MGQLKKCFACNLYIIKNNITINKMWKKNTFIKAFYFLNKFFLNTAEFCILRLSLIPPSI